LKKYVLKRQQKTGSDGADVICCGRLFPSRTTATGKAQSPTRRRLGVGYGEQTVHETKQKADAFKTPTLLDDVKFVSEAWWSQAMKTCQPAQPACNLSVSVTGVLKKAIRPNPLQCYRKVASYKRGHPSFWTKQLTASPSNSRQGLFLVTLICCNVSLLLCNNVC